MYRVLAASKHLGNLRAARAAIAASAGSFQAEQPATHTHSLVVGNVSNSPMPIQRSFSSFAATATQAATTKPKMFCYQCEQTQGGTGCTTVGMCGKSPEVAGLQDLLIYSVKGLGAAAHEARLAGVTDTEVDKFICRGLFSTLTNVNFDDVRFHEFIHESARLQAKLASKMAAAPSADVPKEVTWFGDMPHPVEWNRTLAGSDDQYSVGELMQDSKKVGIVARKEVLGDTIAGLQELAVYGLKGTAAYTAHAESLGATDPSVHASIQEALHFLCTPKGSDVGALLEMAMKIGQTNLTVMKMLSEAHSGRYGHPVPTEVSLAPIVGKCILVTGHDMHDMELLLKATEGKGINVYTHGEMLPAHSYPELKKYKHLVGHFGGAWYQQKMDFSYFPGAILGTTNCVLEPMAMYKRNMFTTNETGLAGIPHINDSKDFTPLINRALELPGFTDRTITMRGRSADKKMTTTVGFGHNTVLSVADQVIDAVKTKKLSHIFLIGGCDGHEPQRDYYSKLGAQLPLDTMVLTLGCAKFRILNQDFGTLPGTGLPRMLDMGQCNDSYSALVVALELAKAFNCSVNDLPLSLDISWFEQKAVAVLLTLLSLGVKNIRLGPALPAFLTADALQVLIDKFDIKPADTSNPDQDLLKMMMGK